MRKLIFLFCAPALAVESLNPEAVVLGKLLKQSCYSCHGGKGDDVEKFGDFFLPNVITRYANFQDPTQSLLYKKVENKEMPKEAYGDNISDEERVVLLEAITKWQQAGAPEIARVDYSDFIRPEVVLENVIKDLKTLNPNQRNDVRYVSFLEIYNNPYKKAQLSLHRQALSKLLNSLSWRKKIKIPKPIDDKGILFRILLSDYGWNPASWGEIEEKYPYYGEFSQIDSMYRQILPLLKTTLPIVRGAWLIATASRPPLYHSLLELPRSVKQLEMDINVNSQENIKNGSVMRLGFLDSGVSQNNRIIERHFSPFGAYWISYDFASSKGLKDIFSFPLGPKELNFTENFEHDGGEVIFNLPNGTQGYLLIDAKGQRIDQGPIEIVSDPSRRDRLVTNGISCMGCHNSGMILKTDQIWPHFEKSGFSLNRLLPNEKRQIRALYNHPRALETMTSDQKRFQKAMQLSGVKPSSPEVISTVTKLYENSLGSDSILVELGFQPNQVYQINNFKYQTLLQELTQKKYAGFKRETFEDVFQRNFDLSTDAQNIEGYTIEGIKRSPAFVRRFLQLSESLSQKNTLERASLTEACEKAEKSQILLSRYIRLRKIGYNHSQALSASSGYK